MRRVCGTLGELEEGIVFMYDRILLAHRGEPGIGATIVKQDGPRRDVCILDGSCAEEPGINWCHMSHTEVNCVFPRTGYSKLWA